MPATENKNTGTDLNSQSAYTINICYSSDKNYAKYLSLSLAAVLLSKNPEDNLHFYILDGGIRPEDKEKILSLKKLAPCEITFVPVDTGKFNSCPMHNSKRLTIASYYRLVISDILPEVEKIIYLDCDMEIKHSLAPLFNTEISQNPLAMVEDIASEKHKKRLNLDEYFNAGMLLMNLDYLREAAFSKKIFDWINVHQEKLKLHDQDVLNLYFAGKIKKLDKKWNFQCKELSAVKTLPEACIIHYVARDKRDFVYNSFPLFLKTPYQKEFSMLYAGRLLKSTGQKIFRIRNLNQEKKELTLLGLKFTLNRK